MINKEERQGHILRQRINQKTMLLWRAEISDIAKQFEILDSTIFPTSLRILTDHRVNNNTKEHVFSVVCCFKKCQGENEMIERMLKDVRIMRNKDFQPEKDALMIRFEYPGGWIDLNQRWMETGPKAIIRRIMNSVDKAKRREKP